MSKSGAFTAAQQRALDVLVGQWAALGHTRSSDIHAGTVRALVGHGYLDADGRTITRAGFDVMGHAGPEIDALGPAIERAKAAAGEVRALRDQLQRAMMKEAQAERKAADAREQARVAVREKREGRHV
jgi:hypothetical protein